MIPNSRGKVLHAVFGWNDPRDLVKGYIDYLQEVSGGLLQFQVVEWRDLDEIYAREDGGRFTIEDFVRTAR